MNAKIGLVMAKSTANLLLSSSHQEATWGSERNAVGNKKYVFPALDRIEFQYYPVTQFIKDNLPDGMKKDDLVYVSMAGCGLETYELLPLRLAY
jgi:hypothetical protein